MRSIQIQSKFAIAMMTLLVLAGRTLFPQRFVRKLSLASSLKPLDYQELMKSICLEWQAPRPGDEVDNIHGLIINSPSITMRHEYLGVDISAVSERILSEGSVYSGRTKPLFALVTGMGRGKTRFCVELDKDLKKRGDVVSVPITFNSPWMKIIREFKSNDVNYAINIVIRMLSVYYLIDYDVAVYRVLPMLQSHRKTLQEHFASFPGKFIRAAVQHMVEEQVAAGRDINHFVLIVDESAKAEEELGKGMHDDLRQCLLDSAIPIPSKPNAELRVNLVMTSLNLKSTGASNSGRPIISLTLPSSLDVELVFEKWVKVYARGVAELSAEQQTRLKFLIVAFATTPRALEQLSLYLASRLSDDRKHPDSSSAALAALNSASLTELFKDVVDAVSIRYNTKTQFYMKPVPFHGLVFGKKVEVGDAVMEGIIDSVWTNVVDVAPKARIVPQTSIGAAYMQAECDEAADFLYMADIRNAVTLLLSHLQGSDTKGKVAKGKVANSKVMGAVLETIARALINCRLQSCLYKGTSSVCIEDLLCAKWEQLLKDNRSNKAVCLLLRTPVHLGSMSFFSVKAQLKDTLSYGNAAGEEARLASMEKFLDVANTVCASAKVGCFVDLHEKEFADGCWLIPTGPNKGDVLALFIDCKAGALIDVNTGKDKSPSRTSPVVLPANPMDLLYGGGKQAQHAMALADMAQSRHDALPGSLLDALRQRRFLYAYLRAVPDQETFAAGDHVVQVGWKDMMKFLSFFRELYLLCRSSYAGALEEIANQKKQKPRQRKRG